MKVKDSRPVLSLNDSEGEWNLGAEPLWKLFEDQQDSRGILLTRGSRGGSAALGGTCQSGESGRGWARAGRTACVAERGSHGTVERSAGGPAGRPGRVARQRPRHGG